MKSMKERIRLRNIEVARFPTVEKIRITTTRNIFAGYDDNGKSVNGTLGDEFDIPKDLSRSAATKLLMSGFAVPADESAKAEKYIPEPARPKKLKLRVEAEPIEMIKIVSAGLRSSENAFFLGNSDGVSLNGKVGDFFSVSKGEITEDLARHLIEKKFAVEKEKPLVRKVIDTVKKAM